MPNAESLESRELERVSDADLALFASAQSGQGLVGRLRAMARELLALRKENEWISVTMQLPEAAYGEDGKEPTISDDVLARFLGGDCKFDICNYDHDNKWWTLPNKGFGVADCEPTHWRPLPAPPAQGGEGR